MNVGALVYRSGCNPVTACLAWVDTSAQKVVKEIPVPMSPNLGLFPQLDCALVSYPESRNGTRDERLEVYQISSWTLRSRLLMDCRAHFNTCPRWPTFLSSPNGKLIYVYKSRTLGVHWAEDYICGLDPVTLEFTAWNEKLPGCVAGLSSSRGKAHAQMLFVADGMDVGSLPKHDLQQKIGFWLGPEEGMGPQVPIGPRPRAHNDLGHARAVLSAVDRSLAVVVCTDGLAHLIDSEEFRYLERQQIVFAESFAMPIFAARLEPSGRRLYVGVATSAARCQGLIERIILHDLLEKQTIGEWTLEEPCSCMALTKDGRHLFIGGAFSGRLWMMDAISGTADMIAQLPGTPKYLLTGGE